MAMVPSLYWMTPPCGFGFGTVGPVGVVEPLYSAEVGPGGGSEE